MGRRRWAESSNTRRNSFDPTESSSTVANFAAENSRTEVVAGVRLRWRPSEAGTCEEAVAVVGNRSAAFDRRTD